MTKQVRSNRKSAEEREARVDDFADLIWRSIGLGRRNRPGRYTVLLFTILLMIVAQPLFATHKLAQAFVTLLMSLVLLAALYSLSESRGFFIFGLILMAPAFIARWIVQFFPSSTVDVIAAISASTFIFFTVIALVRQLFNVRRVTLDTIAAAICAYLLMALAWGFMFALVAFKQPDAFSAGLVLKPSRDSASIIAELHNFIYYSFVCLTTTGYGDIAPRSEIARMLSILESVCGQMYLAVLIARLVSLEVAQSMMGDR